MNKPAPPDWAVNLFALSGYEIVSAPTEPELKYPQWYVWKGTRRYKFAWNFTSPRQFYIDKLVKFEADWERESVRYP